MFAPSDSRKHSLARVALTLLAAGGVISTLVWAGPLNPPSGAVSSTYKTLTEVEPRIAINSSNTPGDADSLYRIRQPGSYYLTGSITGVVGKHGIEIVTSGVTLDLNGFDLVGVASMGSFDGVSVTTSGLTNITVMNGSIRNWGQDGINFGTFLASYCRIEGIIATGNTRMGIDVWDKTTVSRCVTNGGSWGIHADGPCVVRDCFASNSTASGIFLYSGGSISNCSTTGNTDGFSLGYGTVASNCAAYSNNKDGFTVSSGCTILNCTARYNAAHGISCESACTIVGNTCANNGGVTTDGAGVYVGSIDNRVEGNNCTGADYGIRVAFGGNIIIKNTCSGNTTNWNVVAGNACLVVSATTGGAILGNSGGASLGSTDPNANFTY